MKKVFSLLSVFSVVSSGLSVVVSCNDIASFAYYKDQIKVNLETEENVPINNEVLGALKDQEPSINKTINMNNYFESSTDKLINNISYDFLLIATKMAVSNVIDSSQLYTADQGGDYKIEISKKVSSKGEYLKITSGTLLTTEAIKIKLISVEGSKNWSGKADIDLNTKSVV